MKHKADMDKLVSINDLEALGARLAAEHDSNIPTIVISAGTCGQASGANDLIRIAKREILAKRLVKKIGLRITGCHGFCEMEPSILIEPRDTFYPKVSPDSFAQIIEAASRNEIVEDLLLKDPVTGKSIER